MKLRILSLLVALALLLAGCTMAPVVPGETTGAVTTLDGTHNVGAESYLDPNDPDLPPDPSHADADDNGLCDDCGESVVILLDLFAINDLHGKLCDTATQGGVDELTTYLKGKARSEEHVMILSSGDMWQGSSESNLTRGMMVTEWMNELNFVSMTLGNHEYDWGEEAVEANAALAEFPFLGINIFDRETHDRPSYCQSSVLVERGGARIGVIGAIGDCYSSVSGEVSDGFYFKVGAELTALVKAEAEKLRAAGADFIIYSLHDGHGSSSAGEGSISNSALASYYDPILSEGYVDLVLEGHTHQRYVLRDGQGVYHLQNGGENKGICHAEVEINFANGRDTVSVVEYVDASVYGGMQDDPIVEELMERYEDLVSVGDRVLGNNGRYRNSDELCALVAQLYRDVAEEAFGEYDVVLAGGFISVRSPYNLAAGKVTYAQLQSLLPFDNTLVLCSVKGSDLLSRFIHTDNDRYHISYTQYWEDIEGEIDPAGTYYVLVDTYTSTYAPNRLTEVARYTEGVYARDLLAALIERGGLE